MSDVADRAASGVDAALGYDTGTTSAAAGSAGQAAGGVVDSVRQQATTRLDQGKDTAATGLTSVADAVRRMGQGLREQDQGAITQYAAQYGDALAGQIERLSSYLQGRDVNRLVTEVEGVARRQPALFLGGAFLLGLAGARFIKSSRPAPDLAAMMPDPSRALPPATTPTAGAGAPPAPGEATASDQTQPTTIG